MTNKLYRLLRFTRTGPYRNLQRLHTFKFYLRTNNSQLIRNDQRQERTSRTKKRSNREQQCPVTSAAKFRGCLASLKIVKREREGAALDIEVVAVSARNRGASFSSGGVHQASSLFPAIQAFQSSVHNARTKMSNQRTWGRKKKKNCGIKRTERQPSSIPVRSPGCPGVARIFLLFDV